MAGDTVTIPPDPPHMESWDVLATYLEELKKWAEVEWK